MTLSKALTTLCTREERCSLSSRSMLPKHSEARLHTTKSPGFVLFTTTTSPFSVSILLSSAWISDIFWAISVQRFEQYMIPLCLFGFILFTVSLLKAKGVPVSTALFIISLTKSFNTMLLFWILLSLTQSRYFSVHSSPQ